MEMGSSQRPPPTDMSLVELRDQLYGYVRDTGIIDDMKSKIRATLIKQLRVQDLSNLKAESSDRSGGDALWERVVVSLFCDYLRTYGLSYTLSVFQPEVGVRKRVAEFSRDEVLQVLNISNNSELGRYILSCQIHGSNELNVSSSLVEILFEGLSRDQRRLAGNAVGTQTWTVGEATLSTQLSTLDESYRSRIYKESKAPYEILEERMQQYRKECDARVEIEIDIRTRRLREIELADIRSQEAARYRALAEELRTELEEENNKRAASLSCREEASMASIRARESRIDSTAYEQRQQLILERNDLTKLRESLKNEEQSFKERMKAYEEKLRDREILVDRRERELEDLRKEGVDIADMALIQMKTDLQKQYEEKVNLLAKERAKLEEDRLAALDARSSAEADLARASIDKRRAELAERAVFEAEERCMKLRDEVSKLQKSADNHDSTVPRENFEHISTELESSKQKLKKLKKALQESMLNIQVGSQREKIIEEKLKHWQKRALASEEMLESAMEGRESALSHVEDLRLQLKRASRVAINTNPYQYKEEMPDFLLMDMEGMEQNAHANKPGEIDIRQQDTQDEATISSHTSNTEIVRYSQEGSEDPKTRTEDTISQHLQYLYEEENKQRALLESLKTRFESNKALLAAELDTIKQSGEMKLTQLSGSIQVQEDMETVEDETTPKVHDHLQTVNQETIDHYAMVKTAQSDFEGHNSLVDIQPKLYGEDFLEQGEMGRIEEEVAHVSDSSDTIDRQEAMSGLEKAVTAEMNMGNETQFMKSADTLVDLEKTISENFECHNVNLDDKDNTDYLDLDKPSLSIAGVSKSISERVDEDKALSSSPPNESDSSDGIAQGPKATINLTDSVKTSSFGSRTEIIERKGVDHIMESESQSDKMKVSVSGENLTNTNEDANDVEEDTGKKAFTAENISIISEGALLAEQGIEIQDVHGDRIHLPHDDGKSNDISIIGRSDAEDKSISVAHEDSVQGQKSSDVSSLLHSDTAIFEDSDSKGRLQPFIREDADEVEERLNSPDMKEKVEPTSRELSMGILEVLPPDLPETFEDDEDDGEAIDYDDLEIDDPEELDFGLNLHPGLDADLSAGSIGQTQSSSEGSVF